MTDGENKEKKENNEDNYGKTFKLDGLPESLPALPLRCSDMRTLGAGFVYINEDNKPEIGYDAETYALYGLNKDSDVVTIKIEASYRSTDGEVLGGGFKGEVLETGQPIVVHFPDISRVGFKFAGLN